MYGTFMLAKEKESRKKLLYIKKNIRNGNTTIKWNMNFKDFTELFNTSFIIAIILDMGIIIKKRWTGTQI